MEATVLVTGASGFIGNAVVQRLSRSGYRIRAASRHPASLAGAFSDVVALPSAAEEDDAFSRILTGVTHVVHCAGIAHAKGIPETAHFETNATLTGRLAIAAASHISGRFIYLSSIRAMTGAAAPDVLTEADEPQPADAYGRSKLEGERLVRAAFSASGRFTILRPVLTYGAGARGNLGQLLRLAKLPVPLPVAGLSGKRSLLSLEALAAAVDHVLVTPADGGGTYIVSDREPLTVPEITAAFRDGFGRPHWTLPFPPQALSAIFNATGHEAAWRRLSDSLVADPSALAKTGWKPVDDSRPGLIEVARQFKPGK